MEPNKSPSVSKGSGALILHFLVLLVLTSNPKVYVKKRNDCFSELIIA